MELGTKLPLPFPRAQRIQGGRIVLSRRGIRTSLLAPLGVRTPMLDEGSAWARHAAGPVKTPEEVAEMVTDAVEAERFLILTDPIAQQWMDYKTSDLERWLRGMRRMQRAINR